MKIVIISDNDLKKEIANRVLRNLPKWFGIESSLVEYVENLDDKEFFAAYEDNDYVGFFAVEYISCDAANLYVLGILNKYHRTGIGTVLYNYIQEQLKEKGIRYLTVQTLSSKSTDENYARTRRFYEKQGFVGVYENNKVWGKDNPFILMVKYLGGDNKAV